MPDGYAHGFYVVSESAHVVYAVSEKFNQKRETGFDAFDKEIGIEWPELDVVRSLKDRRAKPFSEVV